MTVGPDLKSPFQLIVSYDSVILWVMATDTLQGDTDALEPSVQQCRG